MPKGNHNENQKIFRAQKTLYIKTCVMWLKQ